MDPRSHGRGVVRKSCRSALARFAAMSGADIHLVDDAPVEPFKRTIVVTTARYIRSQTQPRRGLRRGEAATYVGLSPSMFDKMVKEGRLPKPTRFGGASVWDMRLLDQAFDEPQGSANENENPWG